MGKPRKHLTANQKAELWEKYDGKCWRCGLPIDKHKSGALHWGHIVARSCGGSDEPSNMGPECSGCNAKDNREYTTPRAAKIKRIRNAHIGLKRESKFPNARDGKWKTRVGGRTEERELMRTMGPHDDIKLMRAFLWDMGLVDDFEAYRKIYGKSQ